MKKILEYTKSIQGELVAHRRHFHQNPEVGLHMPNTCDYVMKALTQMGYEPKKIGGYSVVALAGGKKPGKTILLRGDMDALPLTEETDLDFKSQNGCMHACGHDFHTAMMLGAAKALKTMEDEICGTVKLFFQTAEETLQGAKEAVEDGLLENPTVDAAMMIHVLSNSEAPDGMIIAPEYGACYASADWYTVTVTGKGGHGASPHNTISAINMITAVNAGIQEIMSVKVPADQHAVCTVGQIHAGDTSNIIPETAFLSGTIRTFNQDIRTLIRQDLCTMTENIAKARGGTGEVTYTNSAPCVLNNKQVCDKLLSHIAAAIGDDRACYGRDMGEKGLAKTSGSEDFAYVAEKVPSAVFWLAAGKASEGYCYPGHNPKTNFNESALCYGAAAYTAAALGWLKD